MDIVYLSLIDWDIFPQRPQKILSRFPVQDRILYVNPSIVYDIPRYIARPVKLIKGLNNDDLEKEVMFYRGVRQVKNNISTFDPFSPLPFGGKFRLHNRINSHLVSAQIKRAMRFLQFKMPVLWVTSPKHVHLVEILPKKIVCYDCMDNYSAIKAWHNPDLIDEFERTILEKSNIVFASSRPLYEQLSTEHNNVELVPNGVDLNIFKPDSSTQIIDAETKKEKYKIGFVGVMEEWIDFSLIRSIAENHKNWLITMLGPLKAHTMNEVKRCKKYKNIRFLGAKKQTELPPYISSFDVCIIPFILSDVTNSIDPIKLYEFCAMGKQVVATNLESLQKLPEQICYRANNKEEFEKKIQLALESANDISLQTKRTDFAKSNSWTIRAKAMRDKIQSL